MEQNITEQKQDRNKNRTLQTRKNKDRPQQGEKENSRGEKTLEF